MFRPPFSSEEFFAVFSAYNEAIWPFQALLVGAAVAAAALAVFRGDRSSRWIWGILSVLWVWTGVVYHVLHFTAINPAAFAFGAAFVAQGALLFWRGVARGSLPFRARRDASGAAGGALIVYALGIYPLLGLLTGHGFFDSPTFGAPCPVVIYTFGMLLLAPRAPRWLLVIPAAWAALGLSAVLSFGVIQDVGLPLGALVAIVLLSGRRREAVVDGPAPAPARTPGSSARAPG